MDRLALARHGESELSLDGRASGDPRAAGRLTAAGREQARRLGVLLAEEEIDLCVTTELERVRETADLALFGRGVPRLVVPELNEIRYGRFEGGLLADYLAWAWSHGPAEPAPGGGESRADAAGRYAAGLRTILARPEQTALVVAHALPIRYVLNAASGLDPAPVVEQVPYAEPFVLSADEVTRAAERLEAWSGEPVWQ